MEAPVTSRFQVLPSGVRLVRLGAGEHGWLKEYRQILLAGADDFLRRSQLAGTPEGVLMELSVSLESPWRAVWLVLRSDFRLIGWAIAEVRAGFGQAPEVFAVGVYSVPAEGAARGLSGSGGCHPRLGSDSWGHARHLRHTTD